METARVTHIGNTVLLIPCGYHFLGVCAPVFVDGYGYGQWVSPTPYLYPLLTFYHLMGHGHVPAVGHFVLSPSILQVMTYNPVPMWSRLWRIDSAKKK